MNNKLKIGLLINEYDIPIWIYNIIESINNSDHSEIIIIIKKDDVPLQKSNIIQRLWKNRNKILFFLYSKLDHFLFKPTPDAFEIKNFKQLINCPELLIQPRETLYSDFISENDIENIKKYNVDVLLRFGFRILKGEILNVPRYGIWSYHHGDNNINKGGPPYIWELFKLQNRSGLILQILTEKLDSGLKIYESFSSTNHKSSILTKNQNYWKGSLFVPRKLKELNDLGWEEFLKKSEKLNKGPKFYSNKLHTAPNNLETIAGVTRILYNYLKTKVKHLLFRNQWILLYKFDEKENISTNFYNFKGIIPPKDRFWADPFLICKNNKYFIFFEEFIYTEGKGKICMMEIEENGNYSNPSVVLEKDFHLSYPFLFEHSNQLFMIPETCNNNSIEIYQCSDFPLKWEFKKTLIPNIEALDSTIFEYNNKFWLFTNIRLKKGASKNDELFLYFSDDPIEGEWVRHPQNPIVSSAEYSRSAGNIIAFKNKIFRPAQNCLNHYGNGTQLLEITMLSETHYEEKLIQSIYPDWGGEFNKYSYLKSCW